MIRHCMPNIHQTYINISDVFAAYITEIYTSHVVEMHTSIHIHPRSGRGRLAQATRADLTHRSHSFRLFHTSTPSVLRRSWRLCKWTRSLRAADAAALRSSSCTSARSLSAFEILASVDVQSGWFAQMSSVETYAPATARSL